MSLVRNKSLTECETPAAAIDALCSPFGGYATNGSFEPVVADQMPQAYRSLLVHDQHMTRVLSTYHRSPVDLYVMGTCREDPYYSRKIFLTRRGGAQAVELGVARVNLGCLHEAARNEILDARRPLGAILASHERLRRIVPRWFLRFASGSSILRWFGFPNDGPFYGRIGLIYCGGEVAIEVLEIVTLWQ